MSHLHRKQMHVKDKKKIMYSVINFCFPSSAISKGSVFDLNYLDWLPMNICVTQLYTLNLHVIMSLLPNKRFHLMQTYRMKLGGGF